MTTTSSRKSRHFIASLFLTAVFAVVLLGSCKKGDYINHNKNKPSSYSSEVLDKWMTVQLRLMRNATGIPNHAFSRHFVYAGVAALESLAPGLPHEKWSYRWNGLTGLPAQDHSVKYYYPANVNGAMAAINRALFQNASIADKQAIDSLEQALNESFLTTKPQSLVTTSSNFGKAVAAAVFNWSETDGYKNAGNAYTVPVGPGLWKPTPPAFASPATPYWGNNRTVIAGSTKNIQPPPPLAYSADPNSPFFEMVKQVYNVSQTLTDDQKAMATFWRDVPGATSPGHWLSIVQQVVRKTPTALDKAALTYTLTGAAINDGLIGCFQSKYQHNLVRPITYIREVMGQSSWSSFLTTPAHPEYPSAHAVLSSAAADVLQRLYGNVGSFTDHTYDYLSFAARTYTSFAAIGEEAGQSRLYAGIHYQPSIDAGIIQGRKVTANIFSDNNSHHGNNAE